jgi:hypothetical protein
MIYTDEKRAALIMHDVLHPIDWVILCGWIGALALCIASWYWALKHFILVIIS